MSKKSPVVVAWLVLTALLFLLPALGWAQEEAAAPANPPAGNAGELTMDSATAESAGDAAGSSGLWQVIVGSANSSELGAVSSLFTAAIELHAGELEALALLTRHGEFADHVFCSADGAAIQAACMIGLSERCESLEVLLAAVGLGRPVQWRFRKSFMERHKRQGGARAVTGYGLAD